jgi:hypothetical protein
MSQAAGYKAGEVVSRILEGEGGTKEADEIKESRQHTHRAAVPVGEEGEMPAAR